MRRLLALAALAAVGCNNLPVGGGGLGRIPATDSLEILPDSSAGIARYAALGSADTMYLGRDGEYVSRVLLKFSLPDSALDSVSQVQLVLYPTDSTPMGFVCHPCSVDWFANAVTWRVADSSTHWLTPGGDYRALTVCSDSFVNGDSLVVELDPAILPTLIRESYGIILLPLDTGFVGLSSGFTAATAPFIKLYWGADKKTTRTINSSEDAHIADTLPGVGRGRGYEGVGSGFAFRTWLGFNFDTIPVEATIALAELRFLPELEYRRGDTLPLGIHRLTEPLERNGRNPAFNSAVSGRLSYVVHPDSDSVATIDVRYLVQYWTAHPDSNFGLFITAEPEWSRFFRMRIPASGPDAPRLNVLYAMPPADRFW